MGRDEPPSAGGSAPGVVETQFKDAISQQAGRLVQILNDSLHIANDSKNLKTRISRLDLAKDNLAELQALVARYSFVSLGNLGEVEKTIEALASEIETAKQQAVTTQARSRAPKRESVQLAASGPAASIRLRDIPFAVIDLETTGLSAQSGARIVELGIVRIDPGQAPRVALDTLVNPQGPVYCTEIHGIDDDDVVGAPIFADIVGDTVSALEGALVGAFNSSFDMGFLRAEIGLSLSARNLRAPPPHVCLMWLRPLLKLGKRCSLAVACQEEGLQPGNHRAVDDAMACALMWPHYVEFAEKQGILTLGDLARAGTHKYLTTLAYPLYGPADFEDAGGRRGAAALKPRLTKPLDQLQTRAPFAGVREYWHALIGSLVDGVLVEGELQALRDLQKTAGLTNEQIRAVHARIYADRLRELAEDDALTDQEVDALGSLRRELGTIGWAP